MSSDDRELQAEPSGGWQQRTYDVDELAKLCGLPPTVVTRWLERELLMPQRGLVGRF